MTGDISITGSKAINDSVVLYADFVIFNVVFKLLCSVHYGNLQLLNITALLKQKLDCKLKKLILKSALYMSSDPS